MNSCSSDPVYNNFCMPTPVIILCMPSVHGLLYIILCMPAVHGLLYIILCMLPARACRCACPSWTKKALSCGRRTPPCMRGWRAWTRPAAKPRLQRCVCAAGSSFQTLGSMPVDPHEEHAWRCILPVWKWLRSLGPTLSRFHTFDRVPYESVQLSAELASCTAAPPTAWPP